MKSNKYNILIAFGILLEINLLLFADRETVAYGPVIFWLIAGICMLEMMINIFKLSASVKITKPKLFKQHSFLGMIKRFSLMDKKFIDALDNYELGLIEYNKSIFPRYFLICFILFGVSALLVVLK